LIVDLEMHSFVKVDDWYKDGTVLKRMLRKGHGSDIPFTDATVKGNG